MDRKTVRWIAIITTLVFLLTSFGFIGYLILFAK